MRPWYGRGRGSTPRAGSTPLALGATRLRTAGSQGPIPWGGSTEGVSLQSPMVDGCGRREFVDAGRHSGSGRIDPTKKSALCPAAGLGSVRKGPPANAMCAVHPLCPRRASAHAVPLTTSGNAPIGYGKNSVPTNCGKAVLIAVTTSITRGWYSTIGLGQRRSRTLACLPCKEMSGRRGLRWRSATWYVVRATPYGLGSVITRRRTRRDWHRRAKHPAKVSRSQRALRVRLALSPLYPSQLGQAVVGH